MIAGMYGKCRMHSLGGDYRKCAGSFFFYDFLHLQGYFWFRYIPEIPVVKIGW